MERLTVQSKILNEYRLKDNSVNGCQKVIDKLAKYEDAEEQGLLVKIECHCKDCVHWFDRVAGATEHVKLCTVGGYMVGKNGYCVYAEKALAEMKGGL